MGWNHQLASKGFFCGNSGKNGEIEWNLSDGFWDYIRESRPKNQLVMISPY